MNAELDEILRDYHPKVCKWNCPAIKCKTEIWNCLKCPDYIDEPKKADNEAGRKP